LSHLRPQALQSIPVHSSSPSIKAQLGKNQTSVKQMCIYNIELHNCPQFYMCTKLPLNESIKTIHLRNYPFDCTKGCVFCAVYDAPMLYAECANESIFCACACFFIQCVVLRSTRAFKSNKSPTLGIVPRAQLILTPQSISPTCFSSLYIHFSSN
jgi:hypothetical protein